RHALHAREARHERRRDLYVSGSGEHGDALQHVAVPLNQPAHSPLTSIDAPRTSRGLAPENDWNHAESASRSAVGPAPLCTRLLCRTVSLRGGSSKLVPFWVRIWVHDERGEPEGAPCVTLRGGGPHAEPDRLARRRVCGGLLARLHPAVCQGEPAR